ncbi:iron complex outermembrane recepter protein [Mucilaginibacter pineti]|uniref:Iron complex outermembrane recepter protein n=1 Tax=Mucilaginibacter pineti TaxID=1391627 RepID=A0A1G7C382_9SPHI|nr:SusC/RagA family TonB-linked outer membrane protein [Mucilaginibacter pineti]SDE33116.1 iron complex outermembrane recepter protein [Mucilaginibacter pineti]
MKKVYLFKYGLTVLFLICAFSSAFAQKSVFKGKVVDELNQPLPGATIHVKETDQSTVTDANGVFSLVGNNQSVLTVQVTFIGYDVANLVIKANETAAIKLVPNSKSLTEVVVVGYGTVKKTDLTGSVANLGAKDLNPGSVTNPLQQIAGKAAGVNINEVGSEPGVAPSIRIRGITSLSGGNDPLVVVDGVQGNMEFLNQVPPSEIASIDILKDASATAIYGSRGATGVIIITTKKGAAGKATVEYNENTSLDVIPKQLQELTASQWTKQAELQGVDVSANHGSNTDWYNLLTRNGVTQNHTLAFGSGSNGFNYRASVSAINQTGVVLGSNYKKYIARIVATQKALDDKLTLTMNVNTGVNDANYSPIGVGNAAFTSNTISQAYIARPTDPVYNTDGTYFTDPNVFHYTNPYAIAKTVSNVVNQDELFGSLRADLDIYKGLSAGWFGSWRKVNQNTGYYAPVASTITDAVTYNGQAHINNDHTDEKLMDINLSYKRDFGLSHIDATAVYEYQIQTYFGSYSAARGFANDIATYNGLQLGTLASAQNGDVSSYKNDRKLVSYLGRVNYSYNNRYYLTASFRADGSSVFGANHHFGYFPSASAAWRIDQESFMANQKVFSMLKLRGGYGVTGNQQGLPVQGSISLYGLSTNNPTTYFGGQQISLYDYIQNANPDLRWESRSETNLGLDFGLFNDRLTGTVEAYTSKTTNLLYNYNVNISGPFKVNHIFANAGTLQNKGLEASLSYAVIKTKDVSLTLAGNGSLMQNKVLKLSGVIDGIQQSTNYQPWGTNAWLVEGQPIGTYLIYKHTGVNSNGVETFAGQNADGSFDATAQSKIRYNAGQSLPKYNYAFTPSFTYKNFDASMVWRGAGGNKVFNGLRSKLSMLENLGKQNLLQSAIATGIHSSAVQSDEWLESGNYLRFQNLSLGYRINVTNIKFISALRVSLTGQNLALITKYKGLDPEVDASGGSSSGGDYGIYPRTRTFSAGLNVILK